MHKMQAIVQAYQSVSNKSRRSSNIYLEQGDIHALLVYLEAIHVEHVNILMSKLEPSRVVYSC